MTAPSSIKELVDLLLGLINPLLILIGGISLLVFFKGLVGFIWNAGNEKALEEGKSLMIWGILALFVMVSVWGILGFLYNTFGLHSGSFGPLLPQ